MPELPEVETTRKGLNKKIRGLKILDVWTDFPKIIKRPRGLDAFKKAVLGRKIKKIERRGKNILFRLNGGKTMLLHQKLTGHLLVGRWKLIKGRWHPLSKGPLEEKINIYIHLMFWLEKGKMLAFSDLRKFGKVLVASDGELKKLEDLVGLGPEPLEKSFSFKRFKESLASRKGKIKQILMNQEIIAGIGNIYSDEILWEAKVHPLEQVNKLGKEDLKAIYTSIKKVLIEGIRLRGSSVDNYRDIAGEKGHFQEIHHVYQREGEKCSRCGAKIKRLKIGGRSAHFCPKCQKTN